MFNYIPVYSSFNDSFITLFQATMNTFDIALFTDNPVFGPIVLAIFILFSHVLMLNVLIGIVNNLTETFHERIKSEYRSVIIKKYYEYRWDNNYGMLIFMPTPVTALSLVFAPILIITKNPAMLNEFFAKLLYIVYALPQFVLFIFLSLLYTPLLYIKGFIIYGKTGKKVEKEKSVQIFEVEEIEQKNFDLKFSLFKSVIWTFVGLFWLVFAFFRDCVQFWELVYRSPENKNYVEKSFVNSDFIKNVQKAMNSINVPKPSPEEIYKYWAVFDKISSNELSDERADEVLNFFRKFSNPKEEGCIDIEKMKKVVPKRIRHIYDDEYIKRIKNYNLAWLIKGVMVFQRSAGTLNIFKKGKKNEDTKSFDEAVEKLESDLNFLTEKSMKLTVECRNILKSKDKGIKNFRLV